MPSVFAHPVLITQSFPLVTASSEKNANLSMIFGDISKSISVKTPRLWEASVLSGKIKVYARLVGDVDGWDLILKRGLQRMEGRS